jgi:hypothetical protein
MTEAEFSARIRERSYLKLVATLVIPELMRAEEKFPGWPTDLLHQVMIVSEEMGEAQQAALHIIEAPGVIFNDTDRDEQMTDLHKKLDAEMVQVAAMALRFLANREGK